MDQRRTDLKKAITIIIPVFNKWDLTRQCLQSIRDSGNDGLYEVRVVDNASSDETPIECPALGKALFQENFTYHRLPENKNFGPACNLGAEQATTPYVLFLNNDTLVGPDWLSPLLSALEDNPLLGAVGPLLVFPDDRVQHIGVAYYVGGGAAHFFNHIPASHPLALKQRNLQAITGAALLLRKDLFFECGGFHPAYRNGCEDLELCCEIQKRNLGMRCVPQSKVIHFERGSRKKGDNEEHNFSLFRDRCSSFIQPDIYDHAYNEGMEIRLGNPAHVFIADKKSTSETLLAENWDGKNLVRLWDAVEQNPLWEEGYQMLGGILESMKMWDEAIHIRYWQNMFFPRFESAVTLHKLAKTANRNDIQTAAGELIVMHMELAKNQDFILKTLHDHIFFFKKRGTESLALPFLQALAARQQPTEKK